MITQNPKSVKFYFHFRVPESGSGTRNPNCPTSSTFTTTPTPVSPQSTTLGKIWPKFWSYSGNFLYDWANFHSGKWLNIDEIIEPSGHTDRQHHHGNGLTLLCLDLIIQIWTKEFLGPKTWRPKYQLFSMSWSRFREQFVKTKMKQDFDTWLEEISLFVR